jgi:tetratricopeptide (TPR) repeat protein
MRLLHTAPLLAATLLAACAGSSRRPTLGELHAMEADVTEVRVEDGLQQAMRGYRSFLEETPESALTPEAMRRLADLKLEKEYGILGDGELVELPAPQLDPVPAGDPGAATAHPAEGGAWRAAVAADFEPELPGAEEVPWLGTIEAIELYDEILETYPSYEHADEVLYQKARAYDELGRTEEAMVVMERLVSAHPHSRYLDEVQFRRAEYFFMRKRYAEAEQAYAAITRMGVGSEYYELSLYKLGWALYKQLLHEEALHEYTSLLDHKVSTGYDFDQSEDEASERRMADTFRVISLCFSNLGGPGVVGEYFAEHGQRSYEDRVYSHFGDFYLEKLRYQDAAAVYEDFVELYPLHRASPHFSMRVIEIFETGGFPRLVVESKKAFADRYGLESEYWRHFDPAQAPEVLSHLRSNLEDLASHFHALYQAEELVDERPANFEEALRWYRMYLASFSQDEKAPGIHHRLADLLLENRDFGEAAREYERTAYDYPRHDRAAEAGYAAIYAHRKQQEQGAGTRREAVRRRAVESTLRFVDTFPEHEHAAVVLGAAVDDLYEMEEFERAIVTGRRLIGSFPQADPAIRVGAWTVVAHASFDLADYPEAERAYTRVLEMTPGEAPSRQALVDNLAAAIYKQGEQAGQAADHRSAASHFLRIRDVAPTSEIRPAAEYDASAALVRLEDWEGAAGVLEAFRRDHPDHELYQEATRQIAFVYRKAGDLVRAGQEYERVASEAEDEELRREALLLAAEIYEDARRADQALAVYQRYVEQFPRPLETAVETRFRIASLHEDAQQRDLYHDELRRIVAIEAGSGGERTARIRYLAARSALVLSEDAYRSFEEVELVQPFDKNLQEKQRRMDAALGAFGSLLDYEVGEVTAAATFYMAQIYVELSQALLESERPAGLEPSELQDYELALEEEAFPFEERAIEVHEKNLELMTAGVFNPWIEKSIRKLADLVPGRYAKFEASSGFIASIDAYAYRTPRVGGAIGASDESEPEGAKTPVEPAAPADAGSDAARVEGARASLAAAR